MGATNIPYTESLTPRYSRIMDFAIRGHTSGEIAKELDMSPNYISQIMNAANFQHQLSIRRARHEEREDESMLRAEEESTRLLRDNAARAAQEMVDLLDDESPMIRFKGAGDILDRVGPSKHQSGGGSQQAVIINISEKDAAVIQETLAES